MEITFNKKALGFWELLFQSISHISPIGAMIANMTAIASYSGGLLPMTFIFAAIAFLFLLNILIQFSQRISSAGGFYGYVHASLGPSWGSRTGWLMILTYWMVVNFSVLFVAGVLIPQTISYFFGTSTPTWSWIPLVFVMATFTWGMTYWGIKTSLRYSIIIMAIGIAVFVISTGAIIGHAGPTNSLQLFFQFSSLHGTTLNKFGVGVIFAMLSLGGASSAIYLSEETPTPQKTVTRAVIGPFLFALLSFF